MQQGNVANVRGFDTDRQLPQKSWLGNLSVMHAARGSDTTSLAEQRGGADTDVQGSRKARLKNNNLALERHFQK